MRTAVIIAVALALTGCATIRRHPVVAGAVVAIVVTGIALSASHHGSSAQQSGYHPICAPYCPIG
jgi:hypothetical protein